MQERLGEAEALGLLQIGHVDELALNLLDDVVVTDKYWAGELLAYEVLLVGDAIGNKTKPNANDALIEEVHFWHFFFFIIDHLVFIGWLELPGHEAKRNVVQEFRLFNLVNVEEALEVLKYI